MGIIKKIIVVTHCVLNQHSVVKGYKRANGSFLFANALVENEVGIVQLQCPELLFKGYNRVPLEYEDYNTTEYRNLCRSLLDTVIIQLKDYEENDIKFIGTVGIKESPTCSISGTRGVLMEELFKLFEENKLCTNYIEVHEEYEDEKDLEVFKKEIIDFRGREI